MLALASPSGRNGRKGDILSVLRTAKCAFTCKTKATTPNFVKNPMKRSSSDNLNGLGPPPRARVGFSSCRNDRNRLIYSLVDGRASSFHAPGKKDGLGNGKIIASFDITAKSGARHENRQVSQGIDARVSPLFLAHFTGRRTHSKRVVRVDYRLTSPPKADPSP